MHLETLAVGPLTSTPLSPIPGKNVSIMDVMNSIEAAAGAAHDGHRPDGKGGPLVPGPAPAPVAGHAPDITGVAGLPQALHRMEAVLAQSRFHRQQRLYRGGGDDDGDDGVLQEVWGPNHRQHDMCVGEGGGVSVCVCIRACVLMFVEWLKRSDGELGPWASFWHSFGVGATRFSETLNIEIMDRSSAASDGCGLRLIGAGIEANERRGRAPAG